MLEIIDQSDLNALKYRCDTCGVEGPSTPARAFDGFLWERNRNPGPVPGRFVRHACDPATVARFAQKATDAAAKAVAEPETVAKPPAPKRGRPKKSAPAE